MTDIKSKFTSFLNKVKELAPHHTSDAKHQLSSHLSESILAVLNEKQIINADNEKEIGAKVQKTSDKIAKDIVKGKITSKAQIAEMLQKTADDITAISGTNVAEGENSRGIGLVAVTTVATTLNNSPLAQSMAKAVMKNLTLFSLDMFDNIPGVEGIVKQVQDSETAMNLIHKAGKIDFPGTFGDGLEGGLDAVEEYLTGHHNTARDIEVPLTAEEAAPAA